MKIFKKTFFIIILGLIFALPASAQLPPLVPTCATGLETPSLACFLVLLSNISKWVLGLSGSLALLFFVYGGFMLLTSRGSESQISKGKEILSRALIGVIIIFGAYFAVDFLTKSLGFNESQYKIPEQGLTEELSGQGQQPTTEELLCKDCTCRQGSIEKVISPQKDIPACDKACKDQAYDMGYCPSLQETASTNQCNCYCTDGASNKTNGITKDLAECKKSCLIKYQTQDAVCGSY